MAIDPIPERQLVLGAASWFRPEAENPVGNQIRVKSGMAYRGAFSIEDQSADQLTAGFSSVSLAGLKRYDLVYADQTGTVQIAQGAEVAAAAPAFNGAPGANLGPPLPPGSPVAYVLIDETGAVLVEEADIFRTTGFIRLARDLDGYSVDKGFFGSAPAGTSDDVSALFASNTRIVPVTGATEPDSGGSATQAGVVTTAPLNYVHLLSQVGDEIKHATGARMYGRLTEAAGVWTLTYFYIDAAGTETSMDPSTDTAGTAPTDVKLAGTPQVFSVHDPARPLFDSQIARLADQVVGDIPTATVAVQGKALKANNPGTQPAVPQIGTIAEVQNVGVELAGGPWHTIYLPSGGATSPGPGIVEIPASAGPPGPPGPAGGTGPTGPPGVGFTTLGAWQQQTASTNPARSGSFVFNFGFTVRMYQVHLELESLSDLSNGAYITAVTPSGTQVTVNWSTNYTGGAAVNFRVGCTAAG